VLRSAGSTREQFAVPAGTEFSPRDDLQCLVVQHRFGQQLLELAVLCLQRPQTLGIRYVHATELPTPQVERRVAEAVLAAKLLDRRARRRLLQETNDLFFGEPLLRVRLAGLADST